MDSIVESSDVTLYTVEDVRRIFGCGRKKAYQITHIPGFPSFKLDGKIYVEKDALKNWLSRCRHKDIFTE